MTLYEVNTPEKFEEYYRSNNLLTVSDKINSLKNTMKVKAILCDEEETEEEILSGLEESAILGCWKAS